ncbi:MAG: hypothetical protein ABSG98_05295 [Anaerolineales bacterium]|jgi:hypothetical protein
MRRPSYASWVSLTLALFSALFLGTALWPASILGEYIPLVDEPLASAQIPVGQGSGAEFALSLRWPTGLRLGQTGTAQLILAPVTGEIPTPTPGFNRVVVAELQAQGLVVDPEGEIAEPLSSAGQASFAWTIQPAYAGTASATMFLRLQLVPQRGGETLERTIWARPLGTRVVAPLGLTQEAELALGVAALIVSAFLMLPRLLAKLGP